MKRFISLLAIVLCLPLTPVEAAGPGIRMTLRIRTSEEPPRFRTETFRFVRRQVADTSLDLAESIEGVEIRVASDGAPREYRVQERYRTSMTVMEEGPHLDLLDWKHYDSPWSNLKETRNNVFVTMTLTEADERKFPPVTKREIVQAVRRFGTPGEARLAGDCDGPTDSPCGVSVSSVYFRIQEKSGATWKTVATVEIHIPMGC